MGIIFYEIDSDIGEIEVNYEESDGKEIPNLVWLGEELASDPERKALNQSKVWLFPIFQLNHWQPPHRPLRAMQELVAELKQWPEAELAQHPKDGIDLEGLLLQLPDFILALQTALEKGAKEVRLADGKDLIELARSGRSRCHGCRQLIAKGALRFGEKKC